MKREC